MENIDHSIIYSVNLDELNAENLSDRMVANHLEFTGFVSKSSDELIPNFQTIMTLLSVPERESGEGDISEDINIAERNADRRFYALWYKKLRQESVFLASRKLAEEISQFMNFKNSRINVYKEASEKKRI